MIKDKQGINFLNSKEVFNSSFYINKRRKFFGHTWLGWLNKIILQWFFVRLTEIVTRDKNDIEIKSEWSLDYWIVPTTGWGNDYKFIGGEPKK